VKKDPLKVYMFGLEHGELDLAQEAAEATDHIDLTKKHARHFYEVLGSDAYFKLVSELNCSSYRTSNIYRDWSSSFRTGYGSAGRVSRLFEVEGHEAFISVA
jgi:hypothetical protein